MMTAKSIDQQRISKKDIILWVLVFGLFIGGIAAYYYFGGVAWGLRTAAALVLICVIIALISQTNIGRNLWGFAKQARAELRKVVWPTRQETLQMTMIVVAMVIIMALILWGIDSLLLWIVGLLTGQ